MVKFETWNLSHSTFGIILPDGWFGRPFDNFHKLTWQIERDNKLILEVDNQLYLTFTKPVKFKIDESTLIIYDWKQFVFDRQGYGDMLVKCDVYKDGELKLVGYPNKEN